MEAPFKHNRDLLATRAELKRAVGAIIANCVQWNECDNGSCLTNSVAQIPNVHRYFDEYLHRMGLENTTNCRVFNACVD